MAGDTFGVAKVPYKKVESGEVTVTGMPDGVTFKRPSTYGISILEKLIDVSTGITFEGWSSFTVGFIVLFDLFFLLIYIRFVNNRSV